MKKTIAILLLVTLLVAALPASALAATKYTVYRVNTKSNNLMVHSQPDGSASTRIGYLAKDAAVVVLKKSGKWRKIKDMRGQVGWVYGSYLASGAYAKVNTKEVGLNIHKKADFKKATIIGSAPKGAKVLVRTLMGNYAEITYQKLKGWASRNYLKWIA